MKQASIQGSKTPSKKINNKVFVPVLYGQPIYIKNVLAKQSREKQSISLWGRGFFDKKVYLCNKNAKNQSQFTIQPKKGAKNFDGDTTKPVLFGAQVLIKHVLSGEYLAINQCDQMPILQLKQKQSSNCYFQFVPRRTFQSSGNVITTDSIFVILNSEKKLYITDLEITQLPSPISALPKKISRDQTFYANASEQKIYGSSASGSASNIQFQFQQKDQANIESGFKKKSQIKKVNTLQIFDPIQQTKQSTFQKTKNEGQINMLPKLFKTESIEQDVSSIKKKPTRQRISRASYQLKKQFNESDASFTHSELPIFKKQSGIKNCSVQNYSYSDWQFQHVETSLKTEYLKNNDYIYFTHSQSNQILILDIQKSPPQVSYVKNTNQGQGEYILSSIFVVEIERSNSRSMNVYLKHFLTDTYFPSKKNDKDQQIKANCNLIPLLSSKKNQCPPFKIEFAGQQFEKSNNKQNSKYNFHGFWLNQVPKKQIAQIMSIQNVEKNIGIKYLKSYLSKDTRKRQKLLRQFMFIPKIIKELQINKHQHQIKQYYQLLFLICKNNERNKKQCLKYIDLILRHPQKVQILDLLTQLLIDNSNSYLIQKSITPSLIEEQIRQFIKYQGYSISFMRIFRVFCGCDEQPSVRNQGLLFNLFFWGTQQQENNRMTESVFHVQSRLTLPNRFKFQVYEEEGEIYFSNIQQKSKYKEMSQDAIKYLRQYFYLLSDCMNDNNYPVIRKFTAKVSFQLLLKLLDNQKVTLKGPVLSLIYNAYIKPQKKYKPQIFHQDYQKICVKGRLIAYSNPSQDKLREFLTNQIKQNKEYSSTTYRLLLNVFKMSIQNGIWKKFQDLLDLMNQLNGLILTPQRQNFYHNTYEDKAEDRNLLRSKITALSIKITLIEMQTSLWVSDYLSQYQRNQIEHRIIQHIKQSRIWVIDQKILRLCSTTSPQLLRKATILLFKIYNLYKLVNRCYEEAKIECQSKLELTNLFSALQSKQQLKAQDYYLIISSCVKQAMSFNQLLPKAIQTNYRNLQSMFKYRQTNEQVQTMILKLGFHQILIADIKRFITLAKKIKQLQLDIIYWKLLTLYAMIKNNLKLRDIVAEHRKIFIGLLESDVHYYVVVDIIEEIYRNNRKLIISDNQELERICKSINSGKLDLRFCKVVNLLSIFIETGNRKIVENHQIILKYVFTKIFVQEIIKLMKSNSVPSNLKQSNQLNKPNFINVLQVVIYDLLLTMNQKKLLSHFEKPGISAINNLLLVIGTSNWNLKSKAFLCLTVVNIKQQQVSPLMRYILYDLNIMCESLKNSNQNRYQNKRNEDKDKDDEQQIKMSKEVKMYISNISKILETINKLFLIFFQKAQKTQSQQEVLVIKIVQRLVILRSLCPKIVHEKINLLLNFIGQIQQSRKIAKNSLRMYLQNIQIGDFQKNEIKDKLPLIYSERIMNKKTKQIRKTDYLKQKTSKAEEQEKKKIKINQLNQNTFQMTDNIKKQLKKLTLSLSKVCENDSGVLSDNIKEFLLNFMRISFLQSKQKQRKQLFLQMQDLLVSYQVPTIVCSILQEPFKHRYKLFCSAFDISIKLLQGGHTNCQQRFLQKFRQDGKNWIFQNIYKIIFDSLTTIQFYYFYKEDPTIKSYEMILEVQQFTTCKQQRRLSCQLLGKAFRFLQLLCQNDNHIMKEYLYSQIDKEGHIKYMTKNFVEVAQRILDGIFKVIEFNIEGLQKIPDSKFQQEIRHNIFPLPLYILDFLIQICQIPAEQNQLYLCRTDFLDFGVKIVQLRKKIKGNEQEMQLSQQKDWQIFFVYQRRFIMLLKSLLEQNSEQISSLMKDKINNQQFQFFIEQTFILGGLEDTQKLKQMLAQSQLNNYVQNIVDVLIIKKILKNQQQLSFSEQKLPIIKQLNQRIQSIHVDFKGHSLTLYFPSHPLFSLLSKKTKQFMLDRSVQLKTRRQKLTEFLLSRQVVYQDINNEQNSQRKLLNQQKMQYLFNFALFICYLIVTLLILFYSVGQSGAVLDIFEVQIISGLSFMQLLISTIYAILVGVNTYPVAREKIKASQAARKRQDPQLQVGRISQIFQILKIIYVDEPQSTHATILFIISTMACFYQVRVYSFSLIFAFAKIQLLQSILKSIRLTWKQLMFVCLLSIAFSFIFGFITLNYYIRPIYQNQQVDMSIRKLDQHCNSIITCIISLYTQNIIGQSVDRQEQQYNYGRFVSDLAYWGFFQILLSNIFAAIIIDKFAQQRNARQKIQNQRYSKCYICFADRNTLQRRGQDFMSHVNHVHSLWNYFFYMYTLENLKDITDFTGIQYWINRQVKQNQIDWIPIDVSFKDQEIDLNYLANKLKPLLNEKEAEEK